MIKAIIFDFGNVIYKLDRYSFLKEISKLTGVSKLELISLFYESSDIMKLYQSGHINSDQFLDKILAKYNINISRDELIDLYASDFLIPIEKNLDLVRRLKPNYKLGLLSNTNELDFKHGIKKCSIIDLFDAITLSFEVGYIKPEREIYLDILNKLNLIPE